MADVTKNDESPVHEYLHKLSPALKLVGRLILREATHKHNRKFSAIQMTWKLLTTKEQKHIRPKGN